MNPLHVDAIVLLRPTYTENKIVVWEEGKFATPLFLISAFEAVQLRDALTVAIETLYERDKKAG